MSNGQVFIVEPNGHIRDQLFRMITALGWQVEILDSRRQILPQLKRSRKQMVFLSAALPDAPEQLKTIRLSGFRATPVVITAFHRDLDRAEKINFFELGADDVLGLEALSKLDECIDRVINPYKYSKEYQAWQERVRQREAFEAFMSELLASNRSWAYMDIRLKNFDDYSEHYGWQVADMVVEGVLDILKSVQVRHGTTHDQWYRTGKDNWDGVVLGRQPYRFVDALRNPLLHYLKPYYNSVDWMRGCMVMHDPVDGLRLCPLMHLAIGLLMPRRQEYQSITELVEAGAEKRRSDPVLI